MTEALARNDTLRPDVITTPWGQTLSAGDADGLIEAYERADAVYREARDCRAELAHALLVLTSGDTKTRYVRGDKRRAKVELPPDSWDQRTLMAVWETYPQYARDVMRIERLKVMLREFGKVEKESGPEAFVAFKSLLKSANLGATGTPRIEIVKGGDA
jgi:hypothetical protein